MAPNPFPVPQAELDRLHTRLDDARLPDLPDGAGWSYGVPPRYLRELADRWQHRFDWRAVEARLAADSVVVDTAEHAGLHVVARRSPRPDAVPLLLIHGWPSTPADFLDLLGPLTDPDDPAAPAFHVVAPSLPGFGFSGPTRELGWDVPRHTRCLAGAMAELGHDRYLVQGGDFGSMIAPEIGRLYPDRVFGVHLNAMVTGGFPDWTAEDPCAGLTEAQRALVAEGDARWEERRGYATIQGTRPATLAPAVTDSPIGLLAWHLEWFVDYDPEATRQSPVDPDAYLANVASFWFTRTAGSAMRLYKEAGEAFFDMRPPSGVPTAVLNLRGDHAIRRFAERSHRVVRWTEHDRGGHFASLQAPDLLVDDIRGFATDLVA